MKLLEAWFRAFTESADIGHLTLVLCLVGYVYINWKRERRIERRHEEQVKHLSAANEEKYRAVVEIATDGVKQSQIATSAINNVADGMTRIIDRDRELQICITQILERLNR